jgi:uncharacterized protein (TIGR00369 family)
LKYIPNDARCFVCGHANEKGLQCRFWVEGDYVVTHLKTIPEYIGHGAIHGGVSVALLDEAMGLSATIKKNCLCVTAELNIRYLKPLTADNTYTIRGRLVADRKILCETDGAIVDEDLNVYIRAAGKYVPLSKERSRQIHPDEFKD